MGFLVCTSGFTDGQVGECVAVVTEEAEHPLDDDGSLLWRNRSPLALGLTADGERLVDARSGSRWDLGEGSLVAGFSIVIVPRSTVCPSPSTDR